MPSLTTLLWKSFTARVPYRHCKASGLAGRARSRFSTFPEQEEDMAKRVGIVGIGIMGTAMMRNLAKDGFEVVGFDVAEAAMQRLAEVGGIAASSPRDVAERVEILITSLPSVDAFEQVTSGQGGIASSNGK